MGSRFLLHCGSASRRPPIIWRSVWRARRFQNDPWRRQKADCTRALTQDAWLRLLRESESSRHRHQWLLDAFSIQNNVIKMGRLRGARHGKTGAQKEHFIAHIARRRCINFFFWKEFTIAWIQIWKSITSELVEWAASKNRETCFGCSLTQKLKVEFWQDFEFVVVRSFAAESNLLQPTGVCE